MSMDEGWYLMSVTDLERELVRWRHPSRDLPPSNARRLSTSEALAYRDRGNLEDELGRTLRLVLRIDDQPDAGSLESKRRRYEPDFLDAPEWRRVGSHKINVIPLRARDEVSPAVPDAWWEDPEMGALEEEWSAHGTAAGLVVPGEWRGFVFKTVAALRASGRPVTPDAVGDSVARWLSPEDAERVRASLRAANPTDPDR